MLALVVGFAVGLPKVESEGVESAALPAELPGGWVALESLDGSQAGAIDYVNGVLGSVYAGEPTEFRAYANEGQQALITATVFAASGGAFAPANGVADPELLGLDRAPVELTRNGDAVCVSSYQSGAQSSGEDPPLSVSCQESHEGRTVQIGSQGLSIDDTVALLGDLVTAVG